jgi:FkbM family methyltransferase
MNATRQSENLRTLPRVWRFLRKPFREKAQSAGFRWASLSSRWAEAISKLAIPVRLPSGVRWIARNDNMREALLAGTFESAEIAFVHRFLRPGMTVLDLGAHNGLYTLHASKLVGSQGKVIAFEPSPRERRALLLHLVLNCCTNVKVERLAVGDENAEASLFVVEGNQTGCNSLRPPNVLSGTSPVRVRVTQLDSWLDRRKFGQIDFVKLDVEGAELAALRGASKLLERRPRPVILAEVQDVRTIPWGYRAKDILAHLHEKGYSWFRLSTNGTPEPLDLEAQDLDGNFAACPKELEPLRDHLRAS